MSLIISLTPPDNYQVRVVRERTIAALFEYSLHIPCYDGTPVGLPTDSWVNDGAIAIDTTNNTFYIYSTGAWRPISGLNFANADLTFTGDREHEMGEFSMSWLRDGDRVLDFNHADDTIGIGDLDSVGNDTKISIEDTNQVIELHANSQIKTTVNGLSSIFLPYGFNPGGSMNYSTNAINATYDIAETDFLVVFTANTFTATLPTAVGIEGRTYILKNTGAGSITIDTDGGTIDGNATYPLASQYKYVQVISNGVNWLIIANN